MTADPRTRLGRTVIVGVVAGLLGLGWVAFRLFAEDAPSTVAHGYEQLDLVGPASIEAGTPWNLEFANEAPTSVVADVWGPWGVRRVELAVVDGSIRVPGDLTRRSGQLSASISTDTARSLVAVEVVPGPAVDGVVPLAGPRSMVADTRHWTMVTAIPVDRFGNSVSDDTPVRLHVRRPDGGVDLVDARVRHLLAGVRVYSTTKAGRSTIRVSVDGATGPEVEVIEVPGPPVDVALTEPDTLLRADGRMLVTVSTESLRDRFGNELLDGTAATAVFSGPSGSGVDTSVTIDGRVEFVIEAPDRPGTVELIAVVDGVSSPSLDLEFVPEVPAVPATVRRVDDDARSVVVVDVGPVLTRLGGFVPDGTAAVLSGGADPVVAEIRDGIARIEVEMSPGGTLSLDVLGTRVELVAP